MRSVVSPIRGHATYLHVRKRKWLDWSSGETFSYGWDLSGFDSTRLNTEFVAFLKYGDCVHPGKHFHIGADLSLDETSLSNGEVYSLLTDKEAHGRKGTLVAMIHGVTPDAASHVLRKLPPPTSAVS